MAVKTATKPAPKKPAPKKPEQPDLPAAVARKIHASRSEELLRTDPHSLIIAGLDEGYDDHILCDSDRNAEPAESLEPLAVDIRQQGVLVPVLVSHQSNGDLVVVAGRRRVRAARLAAGKLASEDDTAKIEVPFIMVSRDDTGGYLEAVIAENEHRRETSIPNKARYVKQLFNENYEAPVIADVFGVSTQAIRNWNRYNTLHTKIRDAVDADKITATAALELASLPQDEQERVIDEILGTAKPAPTPPLSEEGGKPDSKPADEKPDPKKPSVRDVREATRGSDRPKVSSLKKVLKMKSTEHDLTDVDLQILEFFVNGTVGDKPCPFVSRVARTLATL